MINNWQVKKLGEVCEIDNKRNTRKGLAYVGMEDIESDTARFIGSYEPKNVKSSSFYFSQDHLLYGKLRPYLNKVLLPDFEGHCSTEIYPIKVGKEVNKNYLFHWITSEDVVNEINATCTGARMPRANMKEVMEFSIPLPPLPEQKRIVKILDEVFAHAAQAKENAEKNLANAKALFESYLQNIFANPGKDWEEKKLGDVVETTQGIQIAKNFQLKTRKSGYRRYLYISDFDHDENLKYVEDIYPKKIVKANDLIVVNTGASAGKIYKGIDGILSNNLFKVSFNTEVLESDFLYYFVTSSIFKSFQKSIVRGTANPHMGHENFNATPFYMPPLKIQREIVKKLDTLSAETKKLEAIYTQKLTALEELKKSVLKQAFEGRL